MAAMQLDTPSTTQLRPSLQERRDSRRQQYGAVVERERTGPNTRSTGPSARNSEVESLSIDSLLAQGFGRKHEAGEAREGLSPAIHSDPRDGELTPSTADSLCSQLDAFPTLPLHPFYPSLTTKSTSPFVPPSSPPAPPSSYSKPLSPPTSPNAFSSLQTKNLPLKPIFAGTPIFPSRPSTHPVPFLPAFPPPTLSSVSLQKDLPLTPLKDDVPIFDPATPPKQSLPSLPSPTSVTSLESIIGRRGLQRTSSGSTVPSSLATTVEEIATEQASPSSSSGRPLDASDALTPLSATFPLGLGLTTPKMSPRSTLSLNTLRTTAVLRSALPDSNFSPTDSTRIPSPLSSPILTTKAPEIVRPVFVSSILPTSASSTDSDDEFDLMNADDIFSRTDMGLSSSSDSETEAISIENINKALERRKGRTTAFSTVPKRDSGESAKRSSAGTSRRGSTVSDAISPTGERKASFASESRLSVGSLSPAGGWSPRNSIPYKLVRKPSFQTNSPRLSFTTQNVRSSPLAVKEDFAAEELERRLEMCSSEEEEIFDRSLDSATKSPRSPSVKLSPRNHRLRRRATDPEGGSPSIVEPAEGYRFPASPSSNSPLPLATRPIRKQSLAALISEEVEKEMDLDTVVEAVETSTALLPEIQLRQSPVVPPSMESSVEVIPTRITPPSSLPRISAISRNSSIPRTSSLPRSTSSIPRPPPPPVPSPSPTPTPTTSTTPRTTPTASTTPSTTPPSRMKPPSQRTPSSSTPASPAISSGPLGLRQLRLGGTRLSPLSSPLASPTMGIPRKSSSYFLPPPTSVEPALERAPSIIAPTSSISKIGRLRQSSSSYAGVAL